MTDQGVVYAAFVDEELSDEQARRDRLDARSMGILTSSAALVTILASVGTLAFRNTGVNPPPSVLMPMVGAVSALGISGIFGLLAAWPLTYGKTGVDILTELRTQRWQESEITARNNVVYLKIKEISALRIVNNRRVRLLVAGLTVQLLAVFLLIWAVGSLTVVALR